MIYRGLEHYELAANEQASAANKKAATEDSSRARYKILYQLDRAAMLSNIDLEMGIRSLNELIDQAHF